jgi:hypothetical protein
MALFIASKKALLRVISLAQNKASFVDNFQKVFVKVSSFESEFKNSSIFCSIS